MWKRIRIWSRLPPPMTMALAALATTGGLVGAAPGHQQEASIEGRDAGEPIMAIVSLQRQQITIYDGKGWILRAPVSTGQKGRETPAGIFSVLEKDAEHYSNLYDDAFMPHMQRLTWSGIALHGGALPGHPASHGCIRLPFEFAGRLFDVTKVGMRVIVAPSDVAPVATARPSLFPITTATDAEAAAKAAAEADEAARKVDQARIAVAMATREAARASVNVRVAENQRRGAEFKLAAAERAVASAADDAREAAKEAETRAAAALAEVEARLTAARQEAQAKLDAVAPTRQAVIAAAADARVAAERASQLAHELDPVSIFISRKAQRLYVRQAFQEVLDVPITIRDPERPIGTHIFTAMDRRAVDGGIGWTVVSLPSGGAEHAVADRSPPAGSPGGQDIQPASSEQSSPQAAVERVIIPPDAAERIAPMLSPHSSIIISDEGLSTETGRHTDFVVLLSGEPQGGIATRRRSNGGYGGYHHRERYWDSPFRPQSYSNW